MASYGSTRFRTTHNSYSGGARGSIPHQLSAGVRGLELDIHDNGYDTLGDFRLGHLKPGSEVALGHGNPDTARLRDWLGAIARWSDNNATHAPITLVLDLKGDLTDAGGDLADLNAALAESLGTRLFTRDDYDLSGRWPDVDDLRGRVLCVLSGHGGSRAAYRWAFGTVPTVAANAAGRVALAYQSTAGDLNCWVGTATPAGIEWQRKATYGLGLMGLEQPAIALNEDGWIVAVHRLERGEPAFPVLESRVGRIGDDGRIKWFASQFYANGHRPSLQIDGNELREIHVTQDGTKRQQVLGTLNRQGRKIDWRPARTTTAAPFVRGVARWRGGELRCSADADGVIQCGPGQGPSRPVRFSQLAFVEEQKPGETAVLRDARFFAATAEDRNAIVEARGRGLVVRAWGFGASNQAPAPPENLPATDTPEADWYATYMAGPDVAG